ncbi:hypothetical protein [Halochromatium sp.]
MASTDPQTEQRSPIWELVPLSDYRLPSAPTANTARRGLSSLKRLFGRRQQQQGPVKAEDELHALEHERLETVAGPIDWREAAQVLQTALEQRSSADAAWFIISPPAAGYAGLLETWAAQQTAACLPSPAYEIVAGDHSGWLADLPQADTPWTLPRLERCWLRHPAGLDLVRDLFDRLLSGKLGFALIGCDSWAWAYLRYVAPTQVVRALTLQAFDGERLAIWLSELASRSPPAEATERATEGAPERTTERTTERPLDHHQQPLRFRHAQSGNLVLAVNERDETAVSSELRYLAAQSRGNPGVALARWRARLRLEPDKPEAADGKSDDEVDAGTAAGPSARADAGADNVAELEPETIWVAPALEFELPSGLDEPEALVLHALLLHDGLPVDVLEGLLPHGRFRTRALLLQLAAVDLVKPQADGCWRVTPVAYAAVRGFLAGRRFLVDDL